METLPNRFVRRKMNKRNGLINLKRKLPFSAWCKICSENAKRGNEIHQSNVDKKDMLFQARLESKEIVQIEFWKKQGHTEEEIEKLRTAWAILTIKDRDTWKKDKKIARAILKEVRQSLLKRNGLNEIV